MASLDDGSDEESIPETSEGGDKFEVDMESNSEEPRPGMLGMGEEGQVAQEALEMHGPMPLDEQKPTQPGQEMKLQPVCTDKEELLPPPDLREGGIK